MRTAGRSSFMDPLREIVHKSYEHILPQLHSANRVDVFLIGKGIADKTSWRFLLNEGLPSAWGLPIRIHYPEYMFNELINTSQYDMLELENILAKSVHVVVICVESPGAIAELGAFANHEELRERLIVIVDRKHKGSRSFIRLGPVRLLERSRKDSVVWWNLTDTSDDSVRRLALDLRARIRKRAQKVSVDSTIQNPLVLESFYLLLLYILGATPLGLLIDAARIPYDSEGSPAEIHCKAAVQSLFNQGWITFADSMYDLNYKGIAEIRGRVRGAAKATDLWALLDEIRVQVLNSQWRKKKIKLGTMTES